MVFIKVRWLRFACVGDAPLTVTLALPMESISQIVALSLRLAQSGKSADSIAKSYLGGRLNENMPFQGIELTSMADLLLMMREADVPHIYGEANTFYITAHYTYSDDYPIGRSYFIKIKNMADVGRALVFFKKSGISLPVVPPTKLEELIRASGFQERIQAYLRRQEREVSAFKGLFQGRKSRTTVGRSIFLNTSGCLLCGAADYLMMSSTLGSENGLMVGFNLCGAHFEKAKSFPSLLEFLADVSGIDTPFSVQPYDTQSHVGHVAAWLPRILSARVEKIRENTITLVRTTGIKIVLRLDGPDSYAYVVIDPDLGEVAKVDSEDHHPVQYGPDHLHHEVDGNKTIESSFTTGTPFIDVVTLICIIEKHERNRSKS